MRKEKKQIWFCLGLWRTQNFGICILEDDAVLSNSWCPDRPFLTYEASLVYAHPPFPTQAVPVLHLLQPIQHFLSISINPSWSTSPSHIASLTCMDFLCTPIHREALNVQETQTVQSNLVSWKLQLSQKVPAAPAQLSRVLCTPTSLTTQHPPHRSCPLPSSFHCWWDTSSLALCKVATGHTRSFSWATCTVLQIVRTFVQLTCGPLARLWKVLKSCRKAACNLDIVACSL